MLCSLGLLLSLSWIIPTILALLIALTPPRYRRLQHHDRTDDGFVGERDAA